MGVRREHEAIGRPEQKATTRPKDSAAILATRQAGRHSARSHCRRPRWRSSHRARVAARPRRRSGARLARCPRAGDERRRATARRCRRLQCSGRGPWPRRPVGRRCRSRPRSGRRLAESPARAALGPRRPGCGPGSGCRAAGRRLASSRNKRERRLPGRSTRRFAPGARPSRPRRRGRGNDRTQARKSGKPATFTKLRPQPAQNISSIARRQTGQAWSDVPTADPVTGRTRSSRRKAQAATDRQPGLGTARDQAIDSPLRAEVIAVDPRQIEAVAAGRGRGEPGSECRVEVPLRLLANLHGFHSQ